MADKRKLFKFYKSYFDVAVELPDKDRLAFYDAIMYRQFFGIEPNLKGLARLVYISQKHSIDAQIKGWEDYYNAQLSDNDTMTAPIIGGTIQVKEQEEEQEKEKHSCLTFDAFWNLYDKKVGKEKSAKLYGKTTESDRQKMIEFIPKYKAYQPNERYRKNPETFLFNKTWNDELSGFNQTQIDYSTAPAGMVWKNGQLVEKSKPLDYR